MCYKKSDNNIGKDNYRNVYFLKSYKEILESLNLLFLSVEMQKVLKNKRFFLNLIKSYKS